MLTIPTGWVAAPSRLWTALALCELVTPSSASRALSTTFFPTLRKIEIW